MNKIIAIIYKDWNQIAHMTFLNISKEDAMIQINKTHTNIKNIIWK